jgi:hypothetical protein
MPTKLEFQNQKNLQSFFFIFFFLTISRLIPHEPNFTPILSISILGFLFSTILSVKVLIVLGSIMAIPFFKNTILSTFFYCILILLTKNFYQIQKKK